MSYNMDYNIEDEITKNAKHMVKYINQYINKNDDYYDKILEIKQDKELKKEFNDVQWTWIIYQAWVLAYKKAMEDNYISLEERHALNNIYNLTRKFQHDPMCRVVLNQKILQDFKNIYHIDYKEDVIERKWEPPKPTPWDNN